MEIFPRDLGTDRYLATLRRRLNPLASSSSNQANGIPYPALPDASTRRGRLARRGARLRRYWVRDLKLDGETGDKVGDLVWRGAPGTGARVGAIILSIYVLGFSLITAGAGAPVAIPIFLFFLWAFLTAVVLVSPKQTVKKAHERELTAPEVELLLPTARGRLERSFLNLVLDALRMEVPSVSAQGDIRAALRDLGETISRLPADAAPAIDAVSLRREAQERRARAHVENDSFVRASILREADALDRRASLGEENSIPARRASALRREARAQMDALRAVLIAFQHTSQADAASVANLSDAVQRVAREAQATAIARRELEGEELAALLGHALPADLPHQPVAVPVPAPRVTTPPVQQQPQPQVVQSRQWWRGQS